MGRGREREGGREIERGLGKIEKREGGREREERKKEETAFHCVNSFAVSRYHTTSFSLIITHTSM